MRDALEYYTGMRASILMTYRAGDTPERHANLLAVLGWLAQTPQHEVIVVEQDALPTLTQPLPHPNCRPIFAYNAGLFNKGWGMNIAARHSNAPVLAFFDGDMIVPGMLEKSIAHCADYAVVKSYRRLLDLTQEQSVAVRAGNYAVPAHAGAGPDSREDRGEFMVLCGGQFLIRASAFNQLGGFDERFRGWGGEDDALTYAVQRMRLPTIEFDEVPALHLWHPRAAMTHPNYRDNTQLVVRYRDYTEAELQRLCEVSRNLMGDSKKYEPNR